MKTFDRLVPSVVLCLAAALPAAGQEAVPPTSSPALRMARLVAHVEIVDGVATTSLEQTLRNDGRVPGEAVWVLPLPDGAVADGFRMTVDGVSMESDVLRAEDARDVYERIVRSRRDPGLLEYVGRGCLRARVFPVPPGRDVEVRVVFRQVLPESGGLRRWSFPPGAAGLHGGPPEELVLDLSLRSERPLRNVYSPTDGVQVVASGEHEARASFEGRAGALPHELVVFHGTSEAEFGLDLLSTGAAEREAAEGTFLMLVAPRREWDDTKVTPKSIAFVLDTSGSMSGRKIEQARAALEFFVRSLRPVDRFDVVPFATEAAPFFGELRPASPENVSAALERIPRLAAQGGTNLHDALERGLVRGEADGRLHVTVLLTDGLPTVGTKDPREIEAVASRVAPAARVFVFGVGTDVDTQLLDRLAAASGGDRDYVSEEESLEVKTSALFRKLSHPVLTDLELAVEGVEVERQVPARLPDLFRGSRLELLGRYVGDGPATLRLRGTVDGEPREFVYEKRFAAAPVAACDFLPALWAERRIGTLLDAIRLHGEDAELVDEVRRLGTEYQVVTPYTSHLILEEGLRVTSGGPGAPGALGPSGPTTGGAYRGPGDTGPPRLTGSDSFFLGTGERASPPRAPTLAEVCERLKAAGVLPADAPPEELERLALEVVREMAASSGGLEGLGRDTSGAAAVEASRYLAGLMDGEAGGGGASLARLFSRRVGERVLVLRAGVWTDREIEPELPRTKVEAYSDAYFALLRERPELARAFAFSPRVAVRLGDEVYESTAPREG